MKYIKTKKELQKYISNGYLTKLKAYLKKNAESYSVSENTAQLESDFNFYQSLTTDRLHLCKYGEIFLIDRYYKKTAMICICYQNKRLQNVLIEPVIDLREAWNWRICNPYLVPCLPRKEVK